jgi:nucleotide-binding universal stress UspA family protein
MENVFIVTDFSEAAQNAGKYGVALANHCGAAVTLFHAFTEPLQVPESYLIYTAEDVWEPVKMKLEEEAKMINPGNLVKLEICGDGGTAAYSIIAEAVRREADVIVCGMKGAGKIVKRIFGSTVTALAKKTTIPLIIVPVNVSFKKPAVIAFACETDTQTAVPTVKLLKEIQQQFQSKLTIVLAVEEGEDQSYEARFHPLPIVHSLKGENTYFECSSAANVTQAFEKFMAHHPVDMFAMVTHAHSWFENTFLESVTRSVIFHSSVPILIMPQKKIQQLETAQG